MHPARDAHDTFFMENPATSKLPWPEFIEETKKIHEVGGYDSLGYRYDWKLSDA